MRISTKKGAKKRFLTLGTLGAKFGNMLFVICDFKKKWNFIVPN